MRAEMRKATIPEVAESLPRGCGLNTNRRNERPIMATSTAKAQAATNAPYQVSVPVAFSSPRQPHCRCLTLAQAKARNPHKTAAWSMPTTGRSRTTRYCRRTSTKTRQSRCGIWSRGRSPCWGNTEKSRRLSVFKNSHTLPTERAINIARVRPPQRKAAHAASVMMAIIQESFLIRLKSIPYPVMPKEISARRLRASRAQLVACRTAPLTPLGITSTNRLWNWSQNARSRRPPSRARRFPEVSNGTRAPRLVVPIWEGSRFALSRLAPR